MRFVTALVAALAIGVTAAPAMSATLRLTEFTTPITKNTRVTSAPGPVRTASYAATGFRMDDGAASFIAWCLDLTHSVSKGGPYDYTPTDTPFSNSFLVAGAKERVIRLFDANYSTVNAYSRIDAPAFQLALWEVGYDSDFDLDTGGFQGTGRGNLAGQIAAKAALYLSAAKSFVGPHTWNVTFLENNDRRTRQNLVTASRVPLPAALLLLGGGLVALGTLRRRAA